MGHMIQNAYPRHSYLQWENVLHKSIGSLKKKKSIGRLKYTDSKIPEHSGF